VKNNISYRCHRFPPEIIQYAVCLYSKFTLSYRDIEDLLSERDLDISYETVRRLVNKFGTDYAKRIRSNRTAVDTTWHLDEMVVVISGRKYWLWRAVDGEGEVLEFLVQSRRNRRVALRLFSKLLRKRKIQPRTIVTDKLRSYGAALKSLQIDVDHQMESIETIVQKTRICRFDEENEKCSDSNHRVGPNGFSISMLPSTTSSISNDISELEKR